GPAIWRWSPPFRGITPSTRAGAVHSDTQHHKHQPGFSHHLAGLTRPCLRLYSKAMTDWDAAVTLMAGVLGGDLRTAVAEVALARQRPYYEAEADRATAEAYYANVSLDRLGDLVESTHT